MAFVSDFISPVIYNKTKNRHIRRLSFGSKPSILKSTYGSFKKTRLKESNGIVQGNAILLDTLTKVARPNQQNERRSEISLNLWVLEIKNVPSKKKYYCEIYLDGDLCAQTTSKIMGEMLLWGEEFNLCNLNEVSVITLLVWKCSDDARNKRKKPQRKEICRINISANELNHSTCVEKWYSASTSHSFVFPEPSPSNLNQGILSSTNTAFIAVSPSVPLSNISTTGSTSGPSDQSPMVRIKARYQHIDVLPLSAYSDLITFINDHSVKTLQEIDPYIKVKTKEELAQNIMKISHKQRTAVNILCDLIVDEINKSDDKNLILRGNTMASKAIEIYVKLVGEKYLRLTLSDFISSVLQENDDCEVDPQKDHLDIGTGPTVGPERNLLQYSLQQRQESLLMNVDMIWAKIMSSPHYFPKDIRALFIALRERLRGTKPSQMSSLDQGGPDLCDRIISSCIFLRYICPAILTPSLFGLIQDYPDNPKVIRTFTLVAKCIQTLANFSNLSGIKETYMVFMNNFIENNFKTMRDFLRQISSRICKDDEVCSESQSDYIGSSSLNAKDHLYWESVNGTAAVDNIDLALTLAMLHRQWEDCLQIITPQKFSGNLRNLHKILEDINYKLYSEKEANLSIHNPNKTSGENIALSLPQRLSHKKRVSLDSGLRRHSNDVASEVLGLRSNRNESMDYLPKIAPRRHSDEPVNKKTPTMYEYSGPRRYSADTVPQKYILGTAKSGSRRNSTDTAKPQKTSEASKHQIRRNSCDTNDVRKIDGRRFVGESRFHNQHFVKGKHHHVKATDDHILTEPAYSHVSVKEGKPGQYMTNIEKMTDDQLELEWQTVLCESSRLPSNNISLINVAVLSRSSDSLDTLMNTTTKTSERSSGSAMKSSVRRCKQFQQTAGINSHYYYSSLNSRSQSQLTTNKLPNRSSSSEEINITRQDEVLYPPDSFETLTGSNESPTLSDNFDSELLNQSNVQSTQALHSPIYLGSKNVRLSTLPTLDDCANGGSAFHSTISMRHKQMPVKEDDTIQNSLDNIQQTVNSRMKKLALADMITIELELKRVKLLRRISIQSFGSEDITVSTVVMSYGQRSWTTSGLQDDGSIRNSNNSGSTTMPIKSYLDLAENVLQEAYRRHSESDRRGQGSAPIDDMEEVLVKIFQLNKVIQNRVTSDDRNPSSSEKPPRDRLNNNCNRQSSPSVSRNSAHVVPSRPSTAIIEFIETL